MVRARKKRNRPDETNAVPDRARSGLDVNAVVSYNLKAIRERQGWTQQGGRRPPRPAHRPHLAPGVDLGHGAGLRRRTPAPLRRPRALPALGALRRAHRLLLPSPPRKRTRPSWPTPAGLFPSSSTPPCSADELPAGPRRRATGRDRPQEPRRGRPGPGGHPRAQGRHRRPGTTTSGPGAKGASARSRRQYGDRLDEVADFLADFAAKIKAVGPKTYLRIAEPPRVGGMTDARSHP